MYVNIGNTWILFRESLLWFFFLQHRLTDCTRSKVKTTEKNVSFQWDKEEEEDDDDDEEEEEVGDDSDVVCGSTEKPAFFALRWHRLAFAEGTAASQRQRRTSVVVISSSSVSS